MSSVKKLMFSSLKGLAVAVLLTMTNGNLFAQQDAVAGEKLFKENCARCHYATDQKFVGPGLKGTRDRWKNEENLIAWVKNSSEYLKTGDPYAIKVYEEYGKQLMPPFANLSDEDVLNMFEYIDNPPVPEEAKGDPGASGAVQDGGASGSNNTTYLLIGVAIVLLILARSLNSVAKAMANINREKDGLPTESEKKTAADYCRGVVSWMGRNKKLTGVIGIIVVSCVSYQGFLALNSIGIYTGYEPVQPIAFSHKLHVGQNGIECQYCHTGAEKSMHADIPSTNVCMNCHKAVNEGPTYGKKEISKIYAAIGWNPKESKYFENYASLDKEDVRKEFAEWLEDTPGAIEEVAAQIQKPVEWVQIHNLPEHAFFSHAQHVKVGKIACETCHGEVGEMETVSQYSPLTMGWCIDCHRETEVQYADNGYYARLHEYYKKHYGEYEMKEGQRFTVEKIGGLECSKCHY